MALRRWLGAGAGACVLALVSHAAAQTGSPERGKYIFDAAGCYGCHTQAQGAPLAGGPPLRTPFGTFYAPNITPDRAHGIGRWSEADFIRALRQGVSPQGRHYYPVFPYSSYTKMTTQDLLDLRAFLATVPPAPEPSRPQEVAWPFSWHAALAPWKWLYFKAGQYQPDPARDAQWNRGAYLVEAVTHCGECHTPRNFLGGLERAQSLSGARMPGGELVAPNLTPDKSGLAAWSAADIVDALTDGTLPEGGTLGEEMGEVVRNSTSRLRPDDRAAIAAYLKALPPLPTSVKKKAK
ncbi:MAG TPA: cytochrome c [Pseudolabrys sp.]|nr:cytochrome c [Pseudolabrys sp.]